MLFNRIHKIEDIGNWPLWVKALDEMLEPLSKEGEIYILGSRDSVATKYKEFGGKFEVALLEPLKNSLGLYSSFTSTYSFYFLSRILF